MKILITGSSGFVGKHLVKYLFSKDIKLIECSREKCGDLLAIENWDHLLFEVDIVVHLAARVHIMNEKSDDPLAAFREMNVTLSERIVKSAIKNNVKHFIFLSSIKVNGEGGTSPYNENSIPRPEDAYGKSKYEAEESILRLIHGSKVKLTIIRPPLIYGDGVKGNYASLERAVLTGVPLPFLGFDKKRSFLSVSLLVEYIYKSILDQKEQCKLKILSDTLPLTTPELVRSIASKNNVRARLFWFPPKIIKICLLLVGKRNIYDRLNKELVCDSIVE